MTPLDREAARARRDSLAQSLLRGHEPAKGLIVAVIEDAVALDAALEAADIENAKARHFYEDVLPLLNWLSDHGGGDTRHIDGNGQPLPRTSDCPSCEAYGLALTARAILDAAALAVPVEPPPSCPVCNPGNRSTSIDDLCPAHRVEFCEWATTRARDLAAVEPQGPTSDNGKVDAPWWPVPPETCGQCGSGEFREKHSETRDADLEEGSVLVEFTCQGCGYYIVSGYGHVPEGPTSEEGEPK